MNKTIFITGTSSGMGKETALYFAKNGWNVVATMRNPEKGKFFEKHKNVFVVKQDVLDMEQTETAVKSAVEKFGRIDVLFNCAGYGGVFMFEDKDDGYFRKMFDTNFYGTVNTTRAVIPVMRKQRSGRILNTTSIAGKVGIPFQTAYCAAKHAVSGFTNTLAFELKPFGIYATVFEVGAVKTGFVNAMDNGDDVRIDDLREHFNEAKKKLGPALENTYKNAPTPDIIAERVYKFVHKKNPPVFFRPTSDGKFMEVLRRILPNRRFRSMAAFGLE